MAYGRKYYKEFDGYNAVTKTVYSVLVDIYQDGYVGAATEIEKITASPLQLSLDSSGDPLYTPIKKTSASFNIIDTGQFDYSEFYTSNAKKYKMMITSPVFNWTGYLVPQAVSFDLATNGEFSLTASDGLHLLSTIDYIADPDAILTLADFITDIETKIGLSTFDRSITVNTEYGDIWNSLVYQGMFTDKTYEEALEMVLKSIGMQVRYWKILPIISVESALQTTTIKCTNDFPELNFLAPIKNAKVTQKITTLPNALSGALVDDAKDLIVRTGGYYTLKNWVPASDNGVICSIGQMYTGRFQDNKYTDINVFTNPTNYTYTGSPTPTLSAGSYYKLRKVKSTALSLTFSANFGRIGTYQKFDDGYTTTICPVKWSSIRWGLYDETNDRSFNILTGFWDIVGVPTRTNSNELKVTNPADSYTDILVEVAYLSSFTESLRFYLFQGQVEYNDFSGGYDDRKLPVLSIKSIKLDGEDVVQENELYTSVTGNVAVGENIDVLDYEVEFSDAPTPPNNTSLYYGSALFDNQLNQLLTVIIGANSVSFMQYIFNSILYTQNEIRKKVYTANVVMQSNVSPFWLKTTLKDDTVMVNSCTFDFKTSQLNAELTEIMPYVYREWSIISDSEIGSSEWGGSGGQAGTIGGSTPTIDTSNFVVKTGATAQTIEGNITVNNLYSKGGVVAKALLPTDPNEWPQAGQDVDGVVKYDNVTIQRNANGQLYVVTSGGTVVSFGAEVAGQSVQLIVAAITKTLSLSTHTHSNYLTAITKSMVETVLTGDITTHTHALDTDLTAIAALTGTTGLLKKTALNTWALDTSAYLTAITKLMVETVLTGNITTHTHSQYLTAITKLMVEGVLTGLITTHTHNYLPINSGAATSNAGLVPNGLQYVSSSSHTFGGDLPTTVEGTIANFNGNSTTSQSLGFKLLVPTSVSKSLFYESNYGGTFRGWTKLFDTKNSNLKTVDWSAKDVLAVNGYYDGALVAKYLSSTFATDWPVMTASVLGVAKAGLSLIATAGVLDQRRRHYTTVSAYTDAAARDITAKIALGTGNMTSGTLDQIQLSFAPLTTTFGLNGNIVITATGAGAGLIVSFREDAGTGRWYVCIYNMTGATVVRDGIYINISCKQNV